jgi:hypothetical protein
LFRLIEAQDLPAFRFPFQAMGAACESRLYATDEFFAKDVADAAIGEVRRIEHAYSHYRDDNVVTAPSRVAATSVDATALHPMPNGAIECGWLSCAGSVDAELHACVCDVAPLDDWTEKQLVARYDPFSAVRGE